MLNELNIVNSTIEKLVGAGYAPSDIFSEYPIRTGYNTPTNLGHNLS